MQGQPHRIAVIDLGSNTARLVVYQTIPGYAYRLEDEIREVVRLRQGMTADGLTPEAIERAFFTLRLFKRFCDGIKVDLIIPTATSAVRDAANGQAFLARVQSEIGLTLQLLDGEREAYYGVVGVLNEVVLRDGYVLDIGGGSAQISRVQEQRYVAGQSAPLGALALTERCVHSDPISKRELKALEDEIERGLDRFTLLQPGNHTLVGLGGTIRNLAVLEERRQDFPLNTLRGFTLTAASVTQSIEQFISLPLEKRRKLPGLRNDRADIILAGALVVRAVMCRLGVEQLVISTNGLREGLFFEHFWKYLAQPIAPDVRTLAVLNLARVYDYNKLHANQVRFLAQRLFDQLAPLHNYGAGERELLTAAALLHDIGTLISYNDHDQHSQMLIINQGLAGFTPRETALIALLTRYHRKGTPEAGKFAALLRPGDDLLLLRLAAILRLAEYLERGRNSNVDDVVVTWTTTTLALTLLADVYGAVELWQAQRNAVELMALAFGRQVTLTSTATPTQQETI